MGINMELGRFQLELRKSAPRLDLKLTSSKIRTPKTWLLVIPEEPLGLLPPPAVHPVQRAAEPGPFTVSSSTASSIDPTEAPEVDRRDSQLLAAFPRLWDPPKKSPSCCHRLARAMSGLCGPVSHLSLAASQYHRCSDRMGTKAEKGCRGWSEVVG